MYKPDPYTFHQSRLEGKGTKQMLVHACLSKSPDPHVPGAIPYWYDKFEMDKYLDSLATQLFNNTAAAFDRGLAAGREDGAVKVKALQEIHATELGEQYMRGMKDRENDMIEHDIIPDEVSERLNEQFAEAHAKEIVDERRDAYQAGALYAQERIDAERNPDKGKLETRTNQLLNELYHDRNRMEDIVKDAIKVMDIASEDLSYTVGILDKAREESEKRLPDHLEDLRTNSLVSISAIEQFKDTHGA